MKMDPHTLDNFSFAEVEGELWLQLVSGNKSKD